MTLFVDSIALIGILIAAARHSPLSPWDIRKSTASQSVAIGLLLAGSSVFLARESKSLLWASRLPVHSQIHPIDREFAFWLLRPMALSPSSWT